MIDANSPLFYIVTHCTDRTPIEISH